VALYILGAARHAAREDADALLALREALGIYVDLGNEVYAAHTIEVMAEIATRHGAPVEAARLFGGAAAIRARARVAPYALFDYDAALATLDSSLERERLNAERAAGAADPFLRLVLLALSLTAGDSGNQKESAHPSPNDVLTERQTEILRLVAAGLSNRAIAEELAISERTVERHLSAIYLALDVDRRSSAVAYAVVHGLHRGTAG
ncbi:MAG: response regulator transcription factor, partial [Thermomicrobiales bacterium]|nr:response regulator transcription factor [Thermomicrobiales bacterium]